MNTQQGSLIDPENLQEVLDSARNANQCGQSQFLTPSDFAADCAAPLSPFRFEVCDLNCGGGSLLAAAATANTEHLFGLDITPAPAGSDKRIERILGDLTLVAPLLHDVGFECHLFALNPPWGLLWERERLRHLAESDLPAVANAFPSESQATIDSTLATVLLALHHCSSVGEGFLIANHATMERLVFAPGAPASAVAAHVWARITVAGNPMTGLQGNAWQDTMHVDVLWFARSHTEGPQRTVRCGGLDAWKTEVQALSANRYRWRNGVVLRGYMDGVGEEAWSGVDHEWKQQRKPARTDWNLWLGPDGKIGASLSTFDSKAASRALQRDASDFADLRGQSPMQLVMQRSVRATLLRAAGPSSPWRVEPALRQAVDQAITAYHSERAPLYPLPVVQRLGYLDEEDSILCTKELLHPRLMDAVGVRLLGGEPVPADDFRPVFRVGERYRLSTWTTQVVRRGVRPNLCGEEERLEFTGQDLVICIQGEGDRKVGFLDARLLADATEIKGLRGRNSVDVCAPLQVLLDHFDVPEVKDVSTVNPAQFRANLETLNTLEATLNLQKSG